MIDNAVELLLGVLLLLTIVWCMLVHQRLRRLRADKGEMEGFIGALTVVTERAEAAISGLRSVGEATHEQLARQEDATRKRAEELGRAMEAAGRMLRRMETGYQQAMRSMADAERREPARPIASRDRPGPHPGRDFDEPLPARGAEARQGSAPSEPRPRISDELLRVLQGLR